MQEVTFHSRKLNKLLNLKQETVRPLMDGQFEKVPNLMVRFENGIYRTSNEEEITRIRNTPAYTSKEVFEISGGDIQAIEEAQQKQRTIRGAITSQSIANESGVRLPDDKSMKIAEKSSTTTVCSDCGKEFPDDLGGKKLRMHRIGAHRKKK